LKKLKELRKKLEVRIGEKMLENAHKESFGILKQIFGGKNDSSLVKSMDFELVRKGKMPLRMLNIAKKIEKVNKSKGKLSQSEIQSINSDASELIDALTEYAQRKDIVASEKGIMQISYNGRKADVVLADNIIFVVELGSIRKLENGKLINSDKKEFEEAIAKNKEKLKLSIPVQVITDLKNILGDFEILF